MNSNGLLDTSDYVRVVHYMGRPITGRYDGKDYTFPDSSDGAFLDVHRMVAYHIFGFMNPDKDPALMRLGWMAGANAMSHEDALKCLLEQVRFEEVPPFPPSVVDFKRAKDESAARVVPTSAPMAPGGSSPQGAAIPVDPRMNKRGKE